MPLNNRLLLDKAQTCPAHRNILTREYEGQEAADKHRYGHTQMYPNEEASNAVQNTQPPIVQIPHPTIIPELAQFLALQYTIRTLDKVIAPQETVIGNAHRSPRKRCRYSGSFDFPGTGTIALKLPAVSLVHNYSHWSKHTTEMGQQMLGNLL